MYRDYITNSTMPEKGGGSNHIRRSPEREDLEERKPFTNTDNDGEVHYKEPKKKSWCYLSKGALTLLGLLLLVLIALVAIIIALISSRTTCRSCDQQIPEPSIGQLNHSIFESTSPPDPTQPYTTEIRLPRSVIPSHYHLHLWIDLEKFLFNGSVQIEIRAAESTDRVIIHSNKLTIDKQSVSITDTYNGTIAPINDTFLPKDTQFLVIQMKYSLFRGRTYVLKVGRFEGVLSDDLAGLYRSMYKDQNGNTK